MAHVYDLDSDDESLLKTAASIAREVIAPNAADVDTKGRFPEESVRALGDSGLLGLCVAKEHGGKGRGPRAFVAIAEELGSTCASSAMVFVMHVAATQAIASAKGL